jgi:hypothetical protein
MRLAARCTRGFARKLAPRKTEGAGKTGCALHPRSRVQVHVIRNAHEHTGSAETLRPSLRNGFTAYSALSPVNGSFATVALAKIASRENLTPAPRCQDHTTSPHASAAFVSACLGVHRIPLHVVTIASAPPVGTGRAVYRTDLAF